MSRYKNKKELPPKTIEIEGEELYHCSTCDQYKPINKMRKEHGSARRECKPCFNKKRYGNRLHESINRRAKDKLEQSYVDADQIKYIRNERTHCPYCGKELTSDNTHLDHIRSYSNGGINAPYNIVACCASCNASKKNKNLLEWQRNNDNFTDEMLDDLIETLSNRPFKTMAAVDYVAYLSPFYPEVKDNEES